MGRTVAVVAAGMEVKATMKSKMIVAAALSTCVAWYAYAGSSCSAGAAKSCGAKSEAVEVAKVDTAGVKDLLASGKPVTVLDARSGKWDDGTRIPGAKALNAATPDEEIAQALPDKDAKIVTYCSGLKCPASHALASKLTSLGYKNVTEYPEGIEGWTKAGNEVQKVN